MTPNRSRPPKLHDRPPRQVLGSRLWIACLTGALATALASACVVAAVAMAGAALDPHVVMGAIGGACLFGLVISMFAARWITRGIGQGLRDIEEGIARGHLPESTRGAEWGEIGEVARGVRSLLATDRDLREDEAELRALMASIERAREAVDRWVRTEHWEPLTPGAGGLASLATSLDTGMGRGAELAEQNLEAARLAHAELARLIEEARGSAELAEHGYVEVTALLTTIREIARLTGEIQQAVQAPPEVAELDSKGAESEWRDHAAQAIEELVEVSGASVQRLGEGLVRVREINEQVQLMSNRATLIALNAVVASGRQEPRLLSQENPNTELKQLAREVRTATERVASLSAEIDRAVAAANDSMRDARERVITRFSEIALAPVPTAAAPAATTGILTHWVEQLREMVQDAARKGERLSESQEKVSSAVQRVSRHIEDEARDIEGLVARLTPMGLTSDAPLPGAPHRGAGSDLAGPQALRLIDPDSRGARRGDDSSAQEEGGL